MNLRGFFPIKTYRDIRSALPGYGPNAILRLLPLSFLLSVFEIFGLALLLPLIKIIISPNIITGNRYLAWLYHATGITDHVLFVLFLLGMVSFFFILKNLTAFWIMARQAKISYEIASKLSESQYDQYLGSSYSFHINSNSTYLLRNIAVIPFDFVSGVFLPFIIILNELLVIFFVVCSIVYYDVSLFLSLVIFLIPVFIAYVRFYRKSLHLISTMRDTGNKAMYRNAMDSIEGYREIRLFGKKDFFKPVFSGSVNAFNSAIRKLYLITNFSPKIIETVAVSSVFIIFLSAYLFGKDMAALGSFLVVFALATYRLVPSLNRIIQSFNNIKASYYVFDYFKGFLFGPSKESPVKSTWKSKLNFTSQISVRDLSFRFENKNSHFLQDINFEVQKGSTVGIIGPSGSGKTTLLNILLRLYREQSGGIYVDNEKLDENNLEAWYKLVSFVPQNITLFDGTIADNIAFGVPRDKIDERALGEAIERAQLVEFIRGLPAGWNTDIGDKGLKISGGQRQRIGIARALYHGGEILVFDEATSALDHATEKMLTEAINNISHKNLTIIIVAHRMETLKYCDRIFKIENGRIALQK